MVFGQFSFQSRLAAECTKTDDSIWPKECLNLDSATKDHSPFVFNGPFSIDESVAIGILFLIYMAALLYFFLTRK